MKSAKKILSVIICCVMAFSMVACDKDDDKDDDKSSDGLSDVFGKKDTKKDKDNSVQENDKDDDKDDESFAGLSDLFGNNDDDDENSLFDNDDSDDEEHGFEKPTGTTDFSLEDYAKLMQHGMSSEIEDFKKQGLDCKISVKGKSIVIGYTFINQLSSSKVNEFKKSFDTTMTTVSSLYQEACDQLKAVAKDADSLILEFRNADGTVIYSKEYK